MKKLALIVSLCLATTMTLAAQTQKTATPRTGAATSAGKLCDDPYRVGEAADGWPEAPVYILFHREKSKAPWAPNPAIHLPGIEAASAASARTLVCVEESQIEMGQYDSGEPAYTPSWHVTLVRLSDRKVHFMRVGFYGKEPPGIKFHKGAGVGERPTKMFAAWLPLVVKQNVAVLKTRLKSKEFHEVSALAFSGDGSRLAVVQEPRSTLDGTPPTPITVFDMSTGKTVGAWHVDYLVRGLSVSRSGDLVATGHYGHPEVWDVASSRLAHKLDTSGVDWLIFGPNDALGSSGGGKAAVWDVKSERSTSSGKGIRVALSPTGDWLVLNSTGGSTSLQALDSGRAMATFPGVSVSDKDKYTLAGDGQSLAIYSYFSTRMLAAGSPEAHAVELPNLGVSTISTLAPLRDGFAFGNSDGIVGVASVSKPQPRVFATDHSAIRALAGSPDGKLLAVGDSSGVVTIWELR
jgi:WD domain, G-beta repeat